MAGPRPKGLFHQVSFVIYKAPLVGPRNGFRVKGA